MEIQTHLVKKVARFPKVCTNCNSEIPINDTFHQEEGVKEHLHSLISRSYCSKCYSKYGEKKLLYGMNR
jgi:uncharacterized protein with PIN domain